MPSVQMTRTRPRGRTLLILVLGWSLGASSAPFCCEVCGQQSKGAADSRQPFELPRESSGEKEIALVDRLYPEVGDPSLRRLALERAIEYFPGDRATGFRASARLASLDWNLGNAKHAHERLAKLLAENSGRTNRNTYSWAEIIDGRVLADMGQTSDAVALLQRVALDPSLLAERRVEAATAAAEIQAVKSPQAALDWIQGAASQGRLQGPGIEAEIARLVVVTGHEGELEQRMEDIAGDGSRGESALVAVLEAARTWNSPGDAARLNSLANAVSKAVPAPGDDLKKAVARCRTSPAMLAIQRRLEGILGAKPVSDCYRKMPSDRRTSLDEFARATELASHKRDPERCLDLSLRALASRGADESSYRRIWETAGYADWLERTHPGRIDGRVCPLLLDLCDQFPAANPYFTEGKFLRAERLARKADLVGQRALLAEILAVPNQNPNYLAPACRILGESLETAGEYRQALQAYLQAEVLAESHAAGAQCVLHAVWINLAFGNNQEAKRLLLVLARVPPAVTQKLAGSSQLRELQALVHTGRAEECWNAGRTWWAEWAKIAIALGAPNDISEYAVPEIPDVAALEDAIRKSAREGDKAPYLRQLSVLMSAARWQPSLGPEAASLCSEAFKSSPDSADDRRGFLIRMLASPHPAEIAGLRERKLCLAVNYLDVHQYAEVLRVAGDFYAEKQPDDETTRAMHRVRALAALASGADLAPSAAGLEEDLSNPDSTVQRAMTVGLLSDLYVKLGRGEDSATLLQREMDNPAVAADEQGRDALRARLSRPKAAESTPPPVAKWIRSASLSWYDFAEPKGLDDPRLANLDDVLANPDRDFAPAEQAKLFLLAAGDPRRSPEERNRSFMEAAARIVGWAPDYGRMQWLAATVINDPTFDVQTRLGLLWKILTVLAREGRRADYDSWRGNDLCSSLSPEFRARLGWLDREAALDHSSPKAILGLADDLSAHELTASGVLTLQDCLDFLIRIGAIEEAGVLEKGASGWKFSVEAAPSADTARLEFARQIRIARSINPVHEALASTALERFPDVPASLPLEFINLRLDTQQPIRETETTFRACLRQIADKKFERNDFQFWATLLRVLPEGSAPAAGSLIHAGLDAAANDDIRSQLIVLFFSSLNVDDPSVRAEMEREFARYRDPTASPLCYMMIRLYEIHRDLRLGKPVSLETAFLDLKDPRALIVKQRACLRYYTQSGETEPLRKTIDQIDSAQLLSPGFLVQSLPALELLGEGPELKTAREAAARLLREDVLEAWAQGDESAGDTALDLALVLGDKGALPRAWVFGMESGVGNPLFQGRVLLTQAYLDSDWAQVARRAAALTHSYPHRYSSYWYLALALHHLGREAEAAGPLGTYLEHARDEPEYPRALALANALKGAAPSEK